LASTGRLEAGTLEASGSKSHAGAAAGTLARRGVLELGSSEWRVAGEPEDASVLQ
jgi:hypothetical protein